VDKPSWKETIMLAHELLRNEGILLVRPQGPIQAGDFEAIAKVVDPYIEETGRLRGVMIEAPSFPGWDSFAAFVSHLRFVRDHHRLIAKIAAVSDSAVLSIAPRIAEHFVKAEFRHFHANEREAALAWLRA
jgi:SpoIIAA-like